MICDTRCVMYDVLYVVHGMCCVMCYLRCVTLSVISYVICVMCYV